MTKNIQRNKNTAISIKELLKHGNSPLQIAKMLKISHQLVYYWKNKKNETRKPRKKKLNTNILRYLRNKAKNKSTGCEHVS